MKESNNVRLSKQIKQNSLWNSVAFRSANFSSSTAEKFQPTLTSKRIPQATLCFFFRVLRFAPRVPELSNARERVSRRRKVHALRAESRNTDGDSFLRRVIGRVVPFFVTRFAVASLCYIICTFFNWRALSSFNLFHSRVLLVELLLRIFNTVLLFLLSCAFYFPDLRNRSLNSFINHFDNRPLSSEGIKTAEG